MTIPARTYNVRLSAELGDAFHKLCGEIPALPRSTILRALLSESLLGNSLETQIQIVTKQLLKKHPSAHPQRRKGHGLNAKRFGETQQ